MKISYKFSNLLGCVYRKGNLIFSPDGNRLISPVGNRVTVYDLKNNSAKTLPSESNKNVTTLALSPNGSLLIAINEDGEALLINMSNGAVLYTYQFHGSISSVKFSPDGRKFAVTKASAVVVYDTPGETAELNPFVVSKRFVGMHDQTTTIDWTTDSRVLCVGSKDMNTYVIATQRFENLLFKPIGGHKDAVIGNFFENDSLDLITISELGEVNVWKSDTLLSNLVPEKSFRLDVEEEDEEDELSDDEDLEKAGKRKLKEKTVSSKCTKKDFRNYVRFERLNKFNLKDGKGRVTAVDYHKITRILVTGFESGIFLIHEMPNFSAVLSLRISEQSITAITLNRTGDWIGLGSSGLGQLTVMEWMSQTFVLKQQGHFNCMSCLAYSPDGRFIATGGEDCKVKLWDTSDSFCFFTFNEHTAKVTGVIFNHKSKAFLSSSLDGTVRAVDLMKYRNFRTFTAPEKRSTQFSCLALDPSGDVVAAGAQDNFEIYLWSMQTGHVINILGGHEGPVSELTFSTAHNTLASASWDHTVRLWDVYSKEGKVLREVIQLNSDALAISYRPDGQELAVASLDGQITFWDVATANQTHCIEGRHDLGYTRREKDKISGKKAALGKSFRTLCYTADGTCLLAGGQSKNICIYSIKEQILLKKFELTCNLSLDGTAEFLDHRKMTEWGSMALVDEGHAGEKGVAINVPGVKQADFSSRSYKPEVRVSCVRFSPTGMSWSATTTEGLLVYSLAQNVVFDPFDFAIDITPTAIISALEEKNYSEALMMSFRLNELPLIEEVIEKIPLKEIDYICQNLADVYVDKLLKFVSSQMESSRHVQFYLVWAEKLLGAHTMSLKQRTAVGMSSLKTTSSVLPTITALQKSLMKLSDFEGIYDFVRDTMSYMTRAPKKFISKENEEEEQEEKREGLELEEEEVDEIEMDLS